LKKYVLVCHLGWMNRKFCIQKVGSQEHIFMDSCGKFRKEKGWKCGEETKGRPIGGKERGRECYEVWKSTT